jgi:pseudaminic acid biosynthesis-associated methylase
MDQFKTEQETFWAGNFGDDYVTRNKSAQLLASNISFFTKIVPRTSGVTSLIEFGANIGMNLHAIRALLPNIELSAIEINQHAVAELNKFQDISVYPQSILDFSPDRTWDMVLIKGVLIHINPESLKQVYDLLYRSSSRYICVAEYYNPVPVEVVYRGHSGKLFKRDFAGELLDGYPDLRLVDYGFAYHRDTYFPQDDITWFLLEKGKV